MKSVSVFSVLAIAIMLLSGTSLSEQIDPGIVIDWEEQTSAEATPGTEPALCCISNTTGICHWSTGPGSCPPGSTWVSCPCPWTAEQP